MPLSALFPQAHAQGGFLDFGWSVVNFFLPIEDIGIVLQQMAYAVSDPDKFEPDEFIISLINVVTIFPPAKPLKLVTVPLRSLFRSLKVVNPKFVKHFGGMFSGVMNKARKGDFDTLWHLLPFFVIAVEMYNDPEARKGLEFMFSTVDSGEDILSWVDYLALPAEGWDGEGEIPEVDAFAVNTPPASLPLSFMMNQAHAQGRIIRVSGQVIGAALVKASKRISQEAAQNVPDALKVLARELKHADAATLRKYVFNPGTITAAVGITTNRGARAVGNFLKEKSNARYSPITVLATVAYIEWENACGKLLDIQAGEIEDASTEEVAGAADSLNELECGGKGITGVQNRREIYKLYGRAFADSASGKYDEEPMIDEGVNYEVFGYGHGALFHLNQIAHKQLLHRAGGPKIKEVEGNRWVWLYKDRDSLREGDGLIDKKSPDYKRYIYSAYNRRVDIILGNEGQPEQWHELKSYAALEETGPGRELLAVAKGKSIEPWALGKGQELKGHSEVLHKQFSIDRAAANLKHARLQENTTTRLNDRVDVSPDFKWLFQKFKVKPKPPKTTQVEIFPKFGGETDKKSIYGGLTQSIKNGEAVENKKIYETNMGDSISASHHIEHADLRAFLTSLAGIGFSEAADAIKDEIFEE